MILNDLLDSQDWDALGDDPNVRFLNLLDITHRKRAPILRSLKASSGISSSEVLRHRWEFYTAIIGAAQAEIVAEFKDDSVQSWTDFNTDVADAFDAKLNFYHARTKLALQKRKDETSVQVTAERARRIKGDFTRIKNQINAANIKSTKRDELLKKLQEIEDELNGKRSFNILKTAWLITEWMMAPGALFSTYDLVDGPAVAILKTIGEIKAEMSAEAEAWASNLDTPELTYTVPLALADQSNSKHD